MLQQYAAAFEAMPTELQTASRRAALQMLLTGGLPSTDLEDWKYTDLATPLAAFSVPAVMLPHRAVDVLAPEDELRDGLDALNHAFATQGLVRQLAPLEQLDQPLEAGFSDAGTFGARFLHRRNHLRIGAGARATIVLASQKAQPVDEAESFASLFTRLDLDEGAEITLLRVQDEPATRLLVERLDVRLARNARLNMVSVDLGGRLVRSDINIELAAAGAEVQLHGLFAPTGHSHVDNHTCIRHRAPHCVSREYYRGVVGDSARAIFNGKIVVHEGAHKTDSEQRVANLLLSPKSEVNAKPELEIYNDDVKCAHGATFGQLDEDAVFYLRSRGLNHAAARSLLTYAFAREMIEKIPLAALRQLVQQRFLARLPDGELLRAMLQ